MKIEKVYNEIGGYDLCEVDDATMMVVRVIDSSHNRVERDTPRPADELPELD